MRYNFFYFFFAGLVLLTISFLATAGMAASPGVVFFSTNNQAIVSQSIIHVSPVCSDATLAKFNGARGIAYAPNGDIVIADTLNHRIRKYTPQGGVITIAGTGIAGFADAVAGHAQFNSPSNVAIDHSGNIFVSDTLNNRIRKIDAQGNVTTLAGNGSAGFNNGPGNGAKFNHPLGIGADDSGNVYVADSQNHRIRKIDAQGNVTTFAGTGIAGYTNGFALQSKLNNPLDIIIAPRERGYTLGPVFYFSDYHKVRRIYQNATGWAINGVAGQNYSGYSDSVGGGDAALFNYPRGLAYRLIPTPFGEQTILYVADTSNHRIRAIEINHSGTGAQTVFTLAGTGLTSQNQPASGTTDGLVTNCPIAQQPCNAKLQFPGGIAVSPSGDILITDTDGKRIRKIGNNTPALYTIAGSLASGNTDCVHGTLQSACQFGTFCLAIPGQGPQACQQNTACSCGNSVIDNGEACDPPASGQACFNPQGYSGSKICNSTCSGWSACNSPQFCGDHECNGTETYLSCASDCTAPPMLTITYHRDNGNGRASLIQVTCDNPLCTGEKTITPLEVAGPASGVYGSSILLGSETLIAYDVAGNHVSHSPDKVVLKHCLTFDCQGVDTDVDTTLTLGEQTPSLAGTSLVRSTNNLPVLAYVDSANNSLVFSACTNSTCNGFTRTPTLEQADYFSFAASLAHSPIAAIRSVQPPYGLHAVYCTTPSCTSYQTTVLTTGETTGLYPHILIGSDDLPLITHVDLNTGFYLTKCLTPGCTTSTTILLDANPSVGNSSLVVRPNGLPLITYLSGGFPTQLNVIVCLDLACTTRTASILAYVANPLSDQIALTLANGNPLVARYSANGGEVRVYACDDDVCMTHHEYVLETFTSLRPSTIDAVFG